MIDRHFLYTAKQIVLMSLDSVYFLCLVSLTRLIIIIKVISPSVLFRYEIRINYSLSVTKNKRSNFNQLGAHSSIGHFSELLFSRLCRFNTDSLVVEHLLHVWEVLGSILRRVKPKPWKLSVEATCLMTNKGLNFNAKTG